MKKILFLFFSILFLSACSISPLNYNEELAEMTPFFEEVKTNCTKDPFAIPIDSVCPNENIWPEDNLSYFYITVPQNLTPTDSEQGKLIRRRPGKCPGN